MLRMSLPVVKERRQWLRVLMAIGEEDYTQPNAARVDPEVMQILIIFTAVTLTIPLPSPSPSP